MVSGSGSRGGTRWLLQKKYIIFCRVVHASKTQVHTNRIEERSLPVVGRKRYKVVRELEYGKALGTSGLARVGSDVGTVGHEETPKKAPFDAITHRVCGGERQSPLYLRRICESANLRSSDSASLRRCSIPRQSLLARCRNDVSKTSLSLLRCAVRISAVNGKSVASVVVIGFRTGT